MFEQAEFNMFVRASFNPRNFSWTENELMVRESYINNALKYVNDSSAITCYTCWNLY